MSVESNREAIAVAMHRLTEAVNQLGDALALTSAVAPAGHDVCIALYDARRSAEVAKAKLEILQRRLP